MNNQNPLPPAPPGRHSEANVNQKRALVDAGLALERRAVGDGVQAPTVRGYASVFNVWTTLYESEYLVFREMIEPGAYAAAIREKQDVRLLFNHDSNFVLARTKSGTLVLAEDDKGLVADAELLDSPTIRDLVIDPVKRGDITGMSFAFRVRPEGETITEYSSNGVTYVDRVLSDLDLYDVSIVTYPAYEATSVDVRNSAMDREAEILGRLKRRQLALFDARLRLAEAA